MARKRGSRFRKAIDAQEQYEEIEARQRKLRKLKRGQKIASIQKSDQREANAYKRVREPSDIFGEFDQERDS